MTTFILVSVVVVILLVIGVTQRKKLSLLIRSEANSAIQKATNSVKVIELRISDLKVSIKKMIDSAGDLYAKEIEFKKRILKLNKKIVDLHQEAITYKKNGEDAKAKEKLTLELTFKDQLAAMKSNLETIEKAKSKLELKISKVKNHVVLLDLQITNLKARQATNDTLKKASSSAGDIFENSVDGSIGIVDLEITAEENKLDYIEDQDDSEDTDYSAEAEKAFKDLEEKEA